MRKNLYVIGARGMGRDFVGWCRMTPGIMDQYNLCGFLDDDPTILDIYNDYPPILGPAENFTPGEHDVLFCAMGNVLPRIKYVEMLIDKGGRFETFISPSARISFSARIGEGCFIWNNVVVGSDAKIHDHVMCQSNVVVGHDVTIGRFSVLDADVNCCGFVSIGMRTAVHTGAKIAPHVSVGDDVMIGIGSIVIRDVKNKRSVFGNPAREIFSPVKKS